ncbi:MAG: DNA repair protein RadA, partial [Arenimonas sp.]|nr:DNA repair protein RadA [Arenimonas sp.]
MAKAKTAYVCSDCGASFNKWQGQCGECGAWNTLSEFVIEPAATGKSVVRNTGYAGAIDAPKITPLKLVSQTAEVRVSTGIGELDRVLGGGLVEGSV